jgi:hypothetical protein
MTSSASYYDRTRDSLAFEGHRHHETQNTLAYFQTPGHCWLGPHLLYGKIFIFHLQEYTFMHTTYNNKIVLQ